MPKPPAHPRPAPSPRPFTPVATRPRHDGWTPEKQSGFIDALTASGCVHEACAAVGMSRQSAYLLRTRPDAQGFRLAWDAALDVAIRRLSDECYSRALNGVPVPHFYKGEQVGEHRRYDNRLATFLLRYRDPLRYAATLDQMVYDGHPEAAALGLARARDRMMDEAYGVADAEPVAQLPPFAAEPVHDALARQKGELRHAAERRRRAEAARTEEDTRRQQEAFARRLAEEEAARRGGGASGGGVASALSTSAAQPPPPRPAVTPHCRVIGGAPP